MSPDPESSPRGEQRRVPRFVSCVIKGPLGCLAFLIGAGVVLVLLLPPAGGRLADKLLEEWFAEHHLGSLELADAWVGSFYGPQRIDSVILRDPEDEEVLRASLRAPALTDFHDLPGGARYGPIVIRVASLRIVQAKDGSTNLSRALRPRAREDAERGRRGLEADQPLALGLEVWIERLRFTDALGREGVLDSCVLRGTLHWGPYETRLELEGGPDPGADGAPKAELEFVQRESEPYGTWKRKLDLERLPSVLAGMLVPEAAPLVVLAGQSLDELEWSRDEGRASLQLKDEGARFELEGVLDGRLVASEEGAKLELPCAGARGGEVLSWLLPVLGPPACASSEADHALRLANARWPLDGDWSKLAGELMLEAASARAPLAPGVQALLTGQPPLQAVLEGSRRLGGVRGGVLAYDGLRQPLDAGWLALDGTLELASGALDVRLAGECGGLAFDLGHVVGTRGALGPAPAPRAPSVPPIEPGATPPAPEPIVPRGAEAPAEPPVPERE